MMNDYSFSDLS